MAKRTTRLEHQRTPTARAVLVGGVNKYSKREAHIALHNDSDVVLAGDSIEVRRGSVTQPATVTRINEVTFLTRAVGERRGESYAVVNINFRLV